jgi:hypothetical protein
MVNALRTPQGLHSDSTVHPSTLEELQYQSLLGPLWVDAVDKVGDATGLVAFGVARLS